MEQLTDMGFSQELAVEALSATGGKSIVKATEWILKHRNNGQAAPRQQARVDRFFGASSSGNELKESEGQPPAKKAKQPPAEGEEEQGQAAGKVVVARRPQQPAVNVGAPLAERMRPVSIDDIVGQDHVLGLLRGLVESDSLPSVILWGPPGTGKTSLARAIASRVSYRLVALSAVSSGVKELRDALEEGKRLRKYGQRTLLFVDEVHRFNKSQQDAFLPYVEAGHVVLMGATTENPSFEINAALLSRCKVLTLDKLQPEHIRQLLERAASDRDKGLLASAGSDHPQAIRVEEEVFRFLSEAADGDARVALNSLETSVMAAASRLQGSLKREPLSILEVLKGNVQQSQEEYTRPFKRFEGGKMLEGGGDEEQPATPPASVLLVTMADAQAALQRSHVLYDKSGEEHYNTISALHKSMRGGDADAAIYWLARMLEGGEDPLYVARRLVRFASEDVGLADPQALHQAVACYQACHFLGMPECNVHLAQCAAYLALAPKSVAVYQAIQAAQKHVREAGQNEPVPLHLRNAPTRLMKELGYGRGYIYPPSAVGGIEQQQEYMPPGLRGRKFLSWPPSAGDEH